MTTPATPAPLPAEAVEAAAAAIHLATCNLPGCLDGGGHRTTARVALEAAAPHLAAAERERCAQLAEHVSAAFPPPQCDHPEHWNLHGLNPFADLLRQGGGT